MKGRIAARMRLWDIYCELGYIPWKKQHEPRKPRRERKGVYMGAKETIPFMNDDAKRTFSHLLLRPGYMMRDYILSGQHERYLAPFTALLVFYSVFTLIVAIVQPGTGKHVADDFPNGMELSVSKDSTDFDERLSDVVYVTLSNLREAFIITHLDQYPEEVDTPWKESLAAVEGDLRSKGVPLFLGNFLILWIVMAILLRKYKVSFSGAAAASAYVLCQYCIFMFLALLLSLGQDTKLGVLLLGILLFVDYRQMLGIGDKPALKLTVRSGLIYLAFCILFYLSVIVALVLHAFSKV